jgi:hypothetical protein
MRQSFFYTTETERTALMNKWQARGARFLYEDFGRGPNLENKLTFEVSTDSEEILANPTYESGRLPDKRLLVLYGKLRNLQTLTLDETSEMLRLERWGF